MRTAGRIVGNRETGAPAAGGCWSKGHTDGAAATCRECGWAEWAGRGVGKVVGIGAGHSDATNGQRSTTGVSERDGLRRAGRIDRLTGKSEAAWAEARCWCR